MQRVYVRGSAVHRSWAGASMSLPEVIFSTVRRALDDAAVDVSDVDSVVLGAHDLTDGRSLSSMVTAPAAGAYGHDDVRLGDDAAGERATAALPLRPHELPVWSDVAAALVLSAEPGPVEVRGVGMSTEPY